MKLRILSDLHLDINDNIPFSLPNNDIFTIICGDISGNTKQTVDWINGNLKQGVIIEGNHIGYDSEHSIQYIENFLCQCFPSTSPITYLKDTYKIVDDIVFVGGILWTDFELCGPEWKSLYKLYAAQLMNDFKYDYVNMECSNQETEYNFNELRENLQIRQLRTSDTEQMFMHTLSNIKNTCERFPDKKIIVVTHHAPSIKSVADIYLTDKTTPAFASNLEQFIQDHPNIKLWCHGHIHSASDYQIGDCRIICNPRGYVKYSEYSNFVDNLTIEI